MKLEKLRDSGCCFKKRDDQQQKAEMVKGIVNIILNDPPGKMAMPDI